MKCWEQPWLPWKASHQLVEESMRLYTPMYSTQSPSLWDSFMENLTSLLMSGECTLDLQYCINNTVQVVKSNTHYLITGQMVYCLVSFGMELPPWTKRRSGTCLMGLWMLCGSRTWTRFWTTTRNCVWVLERSSNFLMYENFCYWPLCGFPCSTSFV